MTPIMSLDIINENLFDKKYKVIKHDLISNKDKITNKDDYDDNSNSYKTIDKGSKKFENAIENRIDKKIKINR